MTGWTTGWGAMVAMVRRDMKDVWMAKTNIYLYVDICIQLFMLYIYTYSLRPMILLDILVCYQALPNGYVFLYTLSESYRYMYTVFTLSHIIYNMHMIIYCSSSSTYRYNLYKSMCMFFFSQGVWSTRIPPDGSLPARIQGTIFQGLGSYEHWGRWWQCCRWMEMDSNGLESETDTANRKKCQICVQSLQIMMWKTCKKTQIDRYCGTLYWTLVVFLENHISCERSNL